MITVGEIRDQLVARGMSREEVESIKGKSKLLELLNEGQDSLVIIEDVDSEEEEVKTDSVSQVPSYHSPEWQDYVMSHFTKDELYENNPTVKGLRRVAGLLLGDIVASRPIQVMPVQDATGLGRCTVVYEVQFCWKVGMPTYIDFQNSELHIVTFGGVGGSWHGNTDDTYAVFPEAMAEVRAEARALRKALNIQAVCSDELTQKDTKELVNQYVEQNTVKNWDGDGPITDNQVTVITKMCDRLNIDLSKFINSGEKKYDSINDISRVTATKMLQRLNEYQSAGAESVSIPTSLLKENKNES